MFGIAQTGGLRRSRLLPMLKPPLDVSHLPSDMPHHAERWPVICAACGSSAKRVPLNQSGRLLSLLLTIHRYRCNDTRCGWQGNVFR